MAQLEYEFTVHWGDCDPAGIVFYPNFFRWLDGGTHRLMTAGGADQRAQQQKFGLLGASLASSSCDFHKPISYGDRVTHSIGVSEWRDRSFVVSHVFHRGADLIAAGRETRVCIVRDGNQKIHSIAVPSAFRAAIESVGR